MDFSSLSGLKNGARRTFLWWIISMACVSFFFILYVTGDVARVPLALVIVLPLMAGSVWAYYGLQRERRYNNGLLAQFAAANHWRFTPGETANAFDKGSGSLFREGHSQVVKYVLDGTVNDLPASLFGYDYVTGSGKSRQEHHTTIMRLTLPRVVPQMVIDSLVDGGSNNSSVLPITFDQSQRIDLEGEFSRYFACYAPSGYGVSLLSVIGPDTMLTLMQHAAACDIEIIDRYIYFYWPARANTRDGYEHMYATTSAVIQEIGHKLSASDIYKTAQQASLHGTSQAQGVRLASPQFSPLVFMVCLLALGGITVGFAWLRDHNPGALAAGVLIVIPGTIVFSIIAGRRTNTGAKIYSDASVIDLAHYRAVRRESVRRACSLFLA